MRRKRVFREWQHPRDERGRFSRTGGGSWAKRAAAGFAKAEEGRTTPPPVAGRPRIGRNAKAGLVLNQHSPGAGDVLSRKWTPPEKLPPNASRLSIKQVQDLSMGGRGAQVLHEGAWLDVKAFGSRKGVYYVTLRPKAGGDPVEIDDTGQTLIARPHQLEFKEPLEPAQVKLMAAWRADAARPPRMRTLTKREENIARHRQEVAEGEKALKEARKKARARVRKKYPASDGYEKRDWDYYVNEDDAVLQAERDLHFPRIWLEHAQQPDSNPDTEAFLNKPGDSLPVLEGELNRDRPLAVYGDLMHIEGDDQATFRHLRDLSLVPAELHAIVARMMHHRRHRWSKPDDPRMGAAAGVWVGSRPVTELNHSEDLTDVPTSENDSTVDGYRDDRLWHDVDGVYRGFSGTLIAGVTDASQHRGEHGQPALHEFGHALDDAVGTVLTEQGESLGVGGWASTSPEWRALWRQMVAAAPDMNPYFSKQGEDKSSREMWAEGFGEWARARAKGRQSSFYDPSGTDGGRSYLENVGQQALMREFRVPKENAAAAVAMNAYFEQLVAKLGVDL